MAEKRPTNSDSSNGKPVLATWSSSANEPPPSPGPSALQPYPPSRLISPSNQSSVLVPVRLDVLLFLLNSAARGAQYALPPASLHGGQGSPSPCHHGPPAQHGSNCCSCSSACHGVYQPGGTHQYGEGCGSPAGVTESRNNWHGRDGSGHRSDGKSWPGAHSTGGWNTRQPTTGWPKRPQGEGRGHDNRGSWQGRRQAFERSWGDRRHGAADSTSWQSNSQDRRKEESAFGSSYTSSKRTHEGGLRPPWDAPDAKRLSDNVRGGWKSPGMGESATFLGKPADKNPASTAAQGDSEDWETDYEKGQPSPAVPGPAPCPSHSDTPADPSKEGDCPFPTDPPKSRLLTSSSPAQASNSEAAAAVAKPPAAPDADRSKNGGFVSYLKNLASAPPGKSSSEESLDLVIDTDAELTQPDEEERSTENGAGEGTELLRVGGGREAGKEPSTEEAETSAGLPSPGVAF